jgi:serine/threonine protein kinase
VDEAADVYSLGCILYECIARRQPFAHLAGGPEGAKTYNMLFKVWPFLGRLAGVQ